ncbi:MAG: hypothetical protein ACRDIB_17410, partial [Ardenticatenaceae bacterium]
LRGEAIHTSLSVPRKYAVAACAVAAAALRDFEENWVHLIGGGQPYSPPAPWRVSWDDLCTACGVDFLPRLDVREKEVAR